MLLCTAYFLVRKLKLAVAGHETCEAAFQAIDNAARPEQRAEWAKQEASAQANRFTDRKAMRIYAPAKDKGRYETYRLMRRPMTHRILAPGKADMELLLLAREKESPAMKGIAGVLSTALKLEEDQSVLPSLLRIHYTNER